MRVMLISIPSQWDVYFKAKHVGYISRTEEDLFKATVMNGGAIPDLFYSVGEAEDAIYKELGLSDD